MTASKTELLARQLSEHYPNCPIRSAGAPEYNGTKWSPSVPFSPRPTLQIPKHNSITSRGGAGWPLCPLLGEQEHPQPPTAKMTWGCDPTCSLSPIVPTESPARSPLLTRLASREKGRRPGPRPAGTSSSSPPSSPCQEAAHPPRSSHCRGQDGGARAGARGWDRESEGLWR